MIVISSEEYDKISKSNFKELKKLLHKGLEDEDLRIALERSWKNYMKNFKEAVETYSYVKKLARDVRKIKEYSISNIESLLDKATVNLEKNGASVYLARDSEEAKKIIGDLVEGSELLVKSKSMTGEEVGIREYLESRGVKVLETDIGEFIIQLLNSKPMHTVAPSLHVRREHVAKILREKLEAQVGEDDIPGMVEAIRKYLREAYFKADVGMTGSNVIAAETGSIFIIENEGNARLSSGAPRKHVVLAGVEKIVPTFLDAVKVAEVTMRFAGFKIATYLNVISGPSKTGDIEQVGVQGAQGPKDLNVILLDNGRLKASKDPVLREGLYCLKCGACMYVCPTFRLYGGLWGGKAYVGGIGVVWTAITEGLREAYIQSLFCGLIGRCKVQCPVEIDIPKIVREIRRRYLSTLTL